MCHHYRDDEFYSMSFSGGINEEEEAIKHPLYFIEEKDRLGSSNFI